MIADNIHNSWNNGNGTIEIPNATEKEVREVEEEIYEYSIAYWHQFGILYHMNIT